MFPPFAQFTARHYIQLLIDDLDRGRAELKQITQISQERQGNGLMLGCLVCYDKTSKKRKILYAVSGISKQLIIKNQKSDTIIVPSIADEIQINQALAKNDLLIHQLTEKINNGQKELEAERTKLTTESLLAVFNLYKFTRFDGKKITLNEIIQDKEKLPPTGTGDCCAPKLLDYAFSHNLQPFSMDEIFYGKDSKNKKNGISYSPCDERCGFILPYILGLEILYRDSQICVINKQSGLLSVPGRGEDKLDCAESRLKNLFPECINQPAVHRLDMETSGILILAFTKEAHRNLNMQFENGSVHKKYCAVLEGVLEKSTGQNSPKRGEKSGCMELPFRLDVDNRPYQIYDEVNGKIGITQWENVGVINYKGNKCTKVIFTPLTGRTHQLRLAASDPHGFNLPIVGDSLYGNKKEGQRLLLHCFEVEFAHPVSGQVLHFECKAPF